MAKFLVTAFSGWLAVFLLCAGASVPYFVRIRRPNSRPNSAAFFRRMLPHYWLGFLIPVIAFLHAWISMAGGMTKSVNQAGLWLATVTLILMLVQVTWGVGLRDRVGAGRKAARRIHFWLMAVISVLTIAHVVLN